MTRRIPCACWLATDAAAEGLNLQTHGALPAALRLSVESVEARAAKRPRRPTRPGPRRHRAPLHDTIKTRTSHSLRTWIRKADEIREDLGSANELFDEAAHRRLIDGENAGAVQADLDRRPRRRRGGRAAFKADDTIDTAGRGARCRGINFQALAAEIDLDPGAVRDTLEAAMAIRAGRPQLDCSVTDQTCKVLNPALPGWSEVIDESLRRNTGRGGPRIQYFAFAFSSEPFLDKIAGRLRLLLPDPTCCSCTCPTRCCSARSPRSRASTPPGTERRCRAGPCVSGMSPSRAEALVLLSVEELAVNDLRETFHHWVRIPTFPSGGRARRAARASAGCGAGARSAGTEDAGHQRAPCDLIDEVEPGPARNSFAAHAERLTAAACSRQLERKRWRASSQAGGRTLPKPPG